jgi:hypothetical protein
MGSLHKVMGPPVEKYLLGQLDAQEADALEERYFGDPAFFRKIVLAEEALIKSYLGGRLPPSARERFEARYLTVPQLREKVEEMRSRAETHSSAATFGAWWKPVMAGVAGIAIGLGLWFQLYRRSTSPQQLARVESAAPSPVLSVHLTPGLIKDGDTRPVEFAPPATGTVRFALELPGEKSAIDCTAQLFLVEADGHWRSLWASPKQAHSSEVKGEQELTIDADAADFVPGDFILRVAGPDGQIRESYVFRVIRRIPARSP